MTATTRAEKWRALAQRLLNLPRLLRIILVGVVALLAGLVAFPVGAVLAYITALVTRQGELYLQFVFDPTATVRNALVGGALVLGLTLYMFGWRALVGVDDEASAGPWTVRYIVVALLLTLVDFVWLVSWLILITRGV